MSPFEETVSIGFLPEIVVIDQSSVIESQCPNGRSGDYGANWGQEEERPYNQEPETIDGEEKQEPDYDFALSDGFFVSSRSVSNPTRSIIDGQMQ